MSFSPLTVTPLTVVDMQMMTLKNIIFIRNCNLSQLLQCKEENFVTVYHLCASYIDHMEFDRNPDSTETIIFRLQKG